MTNEQLKNMLNTSLTLYILKKKEVIYVININQLWNICYNYQSTMEKHIEKLSDNFGEIRVK